ncbi:hypothetical protein [Photobacterium sanctipauli]|nr:hypothetical protein [Photobacterium sanctipauli]
MVIILFGGVTNGLMAKQIPHLFKVSTYIDKTDLYPYSLTLLAEPSSLYLEFNSQLGRFDDATTELIVNSNIPEVESAAFTYQVTLVTNESNCQRYSETEPVLVNVMDVYLDGQSMQEGVASSRQYLDEVDESGLRVGRNEILLRSQLIEERALGCSGEIMLEAELAL